MKPKRDVLLAEALQLSDADRASLAEDLLESLDAKAEADRDAAWAEEIERRLSQIDSGQVKLIPWHEVR